MNDIKVHLKHRLKALNQRQGQAIISRISMSNLEVLKASRLMSAVIFSLLSDSRFSEFGNLLDTDPRQELAILGS